MSAFDVENPYVARSYSHEYGYSFLAVTVGRACAACADLHLCRVVNKSTPTNFHSPRNTRTKQ